MSLPPGSSCPSDYVKAQFDRVTKLELLYMKDGRYRLDHPYHSRYTGLFVQSQLPEAGEVTT